MKRGIVFLLGFLLVLPVMANADVISYSTILNGANEAPPNASPGTGSALIVIDTLAHTMNVEATFSGLIGNTTAAHIHGPTAVAGAGNASVATQTPTFTGFPLGVTSGTYTHLFDLTLVSTYRAGFIADNGGTAAGAEAALLAAMADGKAYFNIHTNAFPGGEIRGFLAPTSVPEPSTMLLLGSGLVGLVGYGRRRMKK